MNPDALSNNSGSELFRHEGLIYVRPVGRGICVVDSKGEIGDHIDDELSDGYYQATIIIEKKVPDPNPPEPPALLKPMKPFDPYVGGSS